MKVLIILIKTNIVTHSLWERRSFQHGLNKIVEASEVRGHPRLLPNTMEMSHDTFYTGLFRERESSDVEKVCAR